MRYDFSERERPFWHRIRDFLFQPSIIKKILFGYLSLAALVVVISLFALSSLERLNAMNESIVRRDVRVVEAVDKMIDNLFAQELYGRRYFILKSTEMIEFFWERSNKFDDLVKKIRSLNGEYNEPADRLSSLHAEYNALFLKVPAAQHAEIYNDQIKYKQDELIVLLKEISTLARGSQHAKMRMTRHIGKTAFRVTGALCGIGIILSIGAALLITRNISRSIHQLKRATEEISKGKFEYTSDVRNRDELGDLALAFTEMAKRLKWFEEIHLDASPLTRLPGGIAIENELTRRLDSAAPAAFCFIDLDNFKAFNDRYSYARGNDVIKATARIIEDVVAERGSPGDFVGHIGGDDFVFITTPDRYDEICSSIIERFEKTIVTFYNTGDVKQGYIISNNRQGLEMKFPVMTISMAVINNEQRTFRNPIQLSEIAAELKEYAKAIKGSIYVAERRQPDGTLTGNENAAALSRRPV
jgi:GGDEF domain-containing protein/CHASE3 domain sensor protein